MVCRGLVAEGSHVSEHMAGRFRAHCALALVEPAQDEGYCQEMVLNDFSQTFLFTFRCNGEAHGEPLVEVSVEQLAGYDPSPAADAYKSEWYGKEKDLLPMLEKLGFAAFDIQGVRGALHSHRDADRRLAVTPDQLHAAGFREVAAAVST